MANVTVTWPVARGGTGACAPYSPEQGTTMSEPKKKKNEKKRKKFKKKFFCFDAESFSITCKRKKTDCKTGKISIYLK